ncbi:MAG: RNA polymerase sigma factor [Bacteroidota bacterium]
MNINQQLLKDCAKGDRRAEFQLYKSCYPTLMGVCMRYRKSEEEAASMLNVGFLKVLKYLHKYPSHVPFEAWIRKIMINTLIDDFRKHRKVKELIEYTDFSQEDPTRDLVDFNQADQVFDAEQLELLIRRLPAVSQKVFNLFAIDGYAHKEIAELLGISVGTSKWHLSSARKKLQEMMQEIINNSKVV